jgi:hypothetical protein
MDERVTSPWADWECGPVTFGTALDRVVTLLGTVEPRVLQKISAAMREARFDVALTVGPKPLCGKGGTIAMTLPTKGDMPLGLLPVLTLLGYPEVPPTSITPLAWDRVRAFWEFGDTPPIRGELAAQSISIKEME